MKYYVIKKNYLGPEDLGDVDTIGIYRSPACDWYGRPVVDGHAGMANNWATYGRGAYTTLDEARAKIAELYPERRKVEEYDDCNGNIVELYKPGKYAKMTRGETRDWILDGLSLTGNETDDELREIVEMAELSANVDGCTLHDSAFDILEEEREWRRKEAMDKMSNNRIIEVSELIDWGWEDDWYADMLPDLDPEDFQDEEEMEIADAERRRQYWLLEGWVATSQEAYEAVFDWMGVKYNYEYRDKADEIVRRFRDNATDKYWPIKCTLSYVLGDNYDLDPPNNIGGSGTYDITDL